MKRGDYGYAEEKNLFIRRLLFGRKYSPELWAATITFWHAEVAFDDALRYMDVLESKVK